MGTNRNSRPRFEKVYTSVPPGVKQVLRAEAERRGLQIADVVRELLMQKYAEAATAPEPSGEL